ncbi:MAG: hypothetical protein AAGI09_02150 [Pseudomonadota bacterium]
MFPKLKPIALAAFLSAPLPALAVPSLSFLIDGDTFSQPFAFTNTSDAGEMITAFNIDLAGTGLVFDPVNQGAPGNGSDGTAFAATAGTDVTTGLTGNTVVDGGTTLDILFNDFDPTETFSFLLDVDPADPNAVPTVFGNQMIGATAAINFSDGQQLIGVFAAVVGNDDAAAFTATGIQPIPPVPLPAPALLTLSALGTLGALQMRRRRKSKAV